MNGAARHRAAALTKTAANTLRRVHRYFTLIGYGSVILAGLDTHQAFHALIPGQA